MKTITSDMVAYIEKGTGAHQSNAVWSMDGLCPTLPASTGMKEPPKMFLERGGVTKYEC